MVLGFIDNYFFIVLDWAEIWAPTIPILVLLVYRKQPSHLKFVIIYSWVAWFLNLFIDGIWKLENYLPNWLQSNNPVYNIESVLRFICFALFFINLSPKQFYWFKRILALIFILFLFVNFFFFENFFFYESLSENLLTTEAYILLAYCMQYYLAELDSDNEDLTQQPEFWVVTGLSIFLTVSFFVFLFYTQLLRIDGNLSDNMWYFHNIALIFFCVFLAKAFYDPIGNKYTV